MPFNDHVTHTCWCPGGSEMERRRNQEPCSFPVVGKLCVGVALGVGLVPCTQLGPRGQRGRKSPC